MEITAEAVKSFVSDIEEDSENDDNVLPELFGEVEENFIWRKLSTMRKDDSDDDEAFYEKKNSSQINLGVAPKINGNHNKMAQAVSLKINGSNSTSGVVHAFMPVYLEVFPGLESWKSSKVELWHNLVGHPVQWFCVICIDRRG